MKHKISVADYIILLVTTSYVAITLYFWTFFSMGWYVVGLVVFALSISFYYLVKKNNVQAVYISYILYLLFLILYFIFWGFENWGVAFIGLFVKILTPFFIFANVFGLTFHNHKTK